MPEVDPDARAVMTTVFEREGIAIYRGLVERVEQGEGHTVHVTTKEGDTISGDMLLVAVGRKPNVNGLGLQAAGVAFTEKGITVDKHLKTSVPHIYAAGDCTGAAQFTHYAGFQAFQALRNMLLPLKDKGVIPNVPYVIFTDPEVAQAGLLEAEARQQHGDDVRVSHVSNDEIDRSVTDNDLDGFIKVVHKPNGQVLGVTMVGERAGDALIEFIMAMEHNIKLDGLPLAIHPYPTYSTGIQLLAADFTAEKLLRGLLGKAVRLIVGGSAEG
jgi:pyruvate/2-oxoglutarate dehydrogenase complex dihydrolipoamide dehydrogenase (E3) component